MDLNGFKPKKYRANRDWGPGRKLGHILLIVL